MVSNYDYDMFGADQIDNALWDLELERHGAMDDDRPVCPDCGPDSHFTWNPAERDVGIMWPWLECDCGWATDA